MEETPKTGAHSAAAFVEGGIQDACDDACSICLENFCDSDPSTVTTCKHEFHLQCVLEWCQRSSQCPMCWQPISLKDPTSQELLEAVERERSFRFNPSRNAAIFHHPTLGDFELQHLPVGVSDAELEERIIQHLAAAAAMGRARHIARREGQRIRSSAHNRPQFLVFSTQPNPPGGPAGSPPSRGAEDEPVHDAVAPLPPTIVGEETSQLMPTENSPQVIHGSSSPSGSTSITSSPQGSLLNNRRSPSQSSPTNPDRGGPSEFQSFSENLKSRFNSVSMRCKESISKSTRGWKERLFSRNNTMSDLGSEVRREVNAGIATVSRMMERLDTRDGSRTSSNSTTNSPENSPVAESSNQRTAEDTSEEGSLNNKDTQAPCATSSHTITSAGAAA